MDSIKNEWRLGELVNLPRSYSQIKKGRTFLISQTFKFQAIMLQCHTCTGVFFNDTWETP